LGHGKKLEDVTGETKVVMKNKLAVVIIPKSAMPPKLPTREQAGTGVLNWDSEKEKLNAVTKLVYQSNHKSNLQLNSLQALVEASNRNAKTFSDGLKEVSEKVSTNSKAIVELIVSLDKVVSLQNETSRNNDRLVQGQAELRGMVEKFIRSSNRKEAPPSPVKDVVNDPNSDDDGDYDESDDDNDSSNQLPTSTTALNHLLAPTSALPALFQTYEVS